MCEQLQSSIEMKVAQAVRTPDPSPDFTGRLWQRMTTHTVPRSTLNQAFQKMFRRPGWALAALIFLALLVGTLIIGPERVLAALQKGMGYIRGVGFVSTGQGLSIREPVEVSLNGQSVTVEQFLSSDQEAVLTLRLRGFPPYQDIGLGHGVWLALPDGYSYKAKEYSIGVTETPGEYVGIFKFRPLPAEVNRVTVIWQPAPSAPELKIQINLYPLTEASVRMRLPESYSPESAMVSLNGITMQVDQVSTGESGTGIRLQTYFPADVDYAWPDAATLSDDRGRSYIAIPGVHFEDQGQPVQSTTIPGGSDLTARKMQSTFEFPALAAGAKRLTLTVAGVSFGASLRVSVIVDLGEKPSIGDVFPVNQAFTIGEMRFLIRQARLVSLPGEGSPRVGLVLDIEPEDPTRVRLEQIWLFDSMFVNGYLYDQATLAWTNGWLEDEIPAGIIDMKLRSLRGTILGEWQMEWEHHQP
jgi:hypothetical protein